MVHLTDGTKQSKPFNTQEGMLKAMKEMDVSGKHSIGKPVNKRLLLPVLVVLLILEWIIDTVEKMWNMFHNSVKDITLALESYINEPTGEGNKTTTKGG